MASRSPSWQAATKGLEDRAVLPPERRPASRWSPRARPKRAPSDPPGARATRRAPRRASGGWTRRDSAPQRDQAPDVGDERAAACAGSSKSAAGMALPGMPPADAVAPAPRWCRRPSGSPATKSRAQFGRGRALVVARLGVPRGRRRRGTRSSARRRAARPSSSCSTSTMSGGQACRQRIGGRHPLPRPGRRPSSGERRRPSSETSFARSRAPGPRSRARARRRRGSRGRARPSSSRAGMAEPGMPRRSVRDDVARQGGAVRGADEAEAALVEVRERGREQPRRRPAPAPSPTDPWQTRQLASYRSAPRSRSGSRGGAEADAESSGGTAGCETAHATSSGSGEPARGPRRGSGASSAPFSKGPRAPHPCADHRRAPGHPA